MDDQNTETPRSDSMTPEQLLALCASIIISGSPNRLVTPQEAVETASQIFSVIREIFKKHGFQPDFGISRALPLS